MLSEMSCSCYNYSTYTEDCSCVTDCSECGNAETLETLTRNVDNHNDHDLNRNVKNEITISNHIPIVGNLRRVNREIANPVTMNIEKSRQKKGFIAEDEEEKYPRAPSVENSNKMPLQMKEKLTRNESFLKLQKRNQFRSVSPEVNPDEPDSIQPNLLNEDYKKSGLLVEVENGVPLIYRTNHNTTVTETTESKCLDSPKEKGSSEMGDSGISSDPSSISPNSSSSSSGSGRSEQDQEKINSDEVIKNLVPPGGKKRDTMIRELKTKLKERFPSDTLEEKQRAHNR